MNIQERSSVHHTELRVEAIVGWVVFRSELPFGGMRTDVYDMIYPILLYRTPQSSDVYDRYQRLH